MKLCHIEKFYRPMPDKLSYDHVCKGFVLKKTNNQIKPPNQAHKNKPHHIP